MTPPKFDLVQTDQHATLAGHDARLTQLTMTQSCANPDTGDSCDFQIGMDAWLSEDSIAGLDDRRAFLKAYLHKMGLDSSDSVIQGQMRKFLAPYEASLKQLAGKADALKGYPLKSAIRIAFGGPHCASAQGKQNDAGPGDANSGQAPPTSLGAVAGNLGGKLMGGLFKKKADPAPDTARHGAGSAVHHGDAVDRGRTHCAGAVRHSRRLEAGHARAEKREGIQLPEHGVVAGRVDPRRPRRSA
jgi:hypothetical protein